jgi:hypothetical protein
MFLQPLLTSSLLSPNAFLSTLFSKHLQCVKSCIFWDRKLCTQLKFNRRFEGTYRLHLQGGRITQARNQHEAELS